MTADHHHHDHHPVTFGLFRLEMGFNDQGDRQFQFTVGDRY